MKTQPLVIADKVFESRLFVGTGKYGSGQQMQSSLRASGTELVTMAMRRVQANGQADGIMEYLERDRYAFLPNTSGVRDAKEAIFAAELAREALETNWLKLEIHPDPKYLMPDPIETLKAAEALVRAGFVVLPYIHADPVMCKRLEEVGCAAVMPLRPDWEQCGAVSAPFFRNHYCSIIGPGDCRRRAWSPFTCGQCDGIGCGCSLGEHGDCHCSRSGPDGSRLQACGRSRSHGL